MSLSSRLRVSKDEVVAENGVVTANHPLSSEAGLEMLKKGGNAVDAAVATGFTACVVEPMMTTIGGCGFMLVHLAEEGKSVVIEFSPRAPRAAGPEMYTVEDSAILDIGLQSVANSENIIGPKSASVPGTVAGFCMAHSKYGSLPLEQVMEPAIHHAEQGFEVDWYTAVSIADEMERLVRYPGISGLLLNGGFPPTVGSKLVQRDLGQTLRAVAKSGAKAFYLGDIADAIASDVQASGGILSREDLENYRAEEVDPVSITYRGHTVLAARAVNGGTTALETLSVLNNLDIEARGHNSAEALHLFIEATRHAFADRYRFLGDPEFVSVPLRGLLSAGYGAALAAEMDRVNARLEPEGDTPPWLAYADTAIHDPWAFDPGEGRAEERDVGAFAQVKHDALERNRQGPKHGVVHAHRCELFRVDDRVSGHGGDPGGWDAVVQSGPRPGELDSGVEEATGEHGAGAGAEGRATRDDGRGAGRQEDHKCGDAGGDECSGLRDGDAGCDSSAEGGRERVGHYVWSGLGPRDG